MMTLALLLTIWVLLHTMHIADLIDIPFFDTLPARIERVRSAITHNCIWRING